MRDVMKSDRMRQTPVLVVLVVVLLLSATALHAQTFTVLYNLGSVAGDPTSPTNPGIIAQGRNGDCIP